MTLPKHPRTLAVLALAGAAALLVSACNDGRGARAQGVPAAASTPASPVRAVARGIIELPGGLFEVNAPQDGVVESIAVQEGETVKRGQLLLQLSAEQHRQDLALAQAELRLAQARQQAQQARLPAAAQTAQRLAEAVRAEVMDAQRADEAQQALRDIEANLGVARAETALAEQKVAQVQNQARRLGITAAQDASVLRISVQPGTRVAAQGGKPLLTLLPARALRVRAEVNEAFVPGITLGMRARIHLDSDSANAAQTQLPEAKVVRISPVFAAGRLDDEAQARGNVRVVDCFLEFDRAPVLRIGQAVRVEFHD